MAERSASPSDVAVDANEAAAEAAPEATGVRFVYGEIDSEIGFAESAYLGRLLAQASETEADALVLRLNTFGGRVDAAVVMRDALLDADIPTVVWIDKRAISAGALIAYACDRIAMTSGGTIGAAVPITTSGGGQSMPQPVEEKYLSYFREEMRSTAEAKGRDPDIAEAMVDADAEVDGVSLPGKVLTLGTRRALELKVADLQADDLEELLATVSFRDPSADPSGDPSEGGAGEPLVLAGAEQVNVDRSWSESLVGFLTGGAMASLLFLGMMLFGYLELNSPGFGVFGALAVVCALLAFFSHYLVGLAGSEEILLFAIGVALLAIEAFVIPGFGVAGVLGLGAVAVSLTMVLIAGDWSGLTLSNPFTVDAVEQMSIVLLLAVGSMMLMLRFLPSTRMGRRLTLEHALSSTAGYTSHPSTPSRLGQTGIALGPLRPAGKARIEGQRIDVETAGEFIERGAPLAVVAQREGRVIVRERIVALDPSASERPAPTEPALTETAPTESAQSALGAEREPIDE